MYVYAVSVLRTNKKREPIAELPLCWTEVVWLLGRDRLLAVHRLAGCEIGLFGFLLLLDLLGHRLGDRDHEPSELHRVVAEVLELGLDPGDPLFVGGEGLVSRDLIADDHMAPSAIPAEILTANPAAESVFDGGEIGRFALAVIMGEEVGRLRTSPLGVLGAEHHQRGRLVGNLGDRRRLGGVFRFDPRRRHQFDRTGLGGSIGRTRGLGVLGAGDVRRGLVEGCLAAARCLASRIGGRGGELIEVCHGIIPFLLAVGRGYSLPMLPL